MQIELDRVLRGTDSGTGYSFWKRFIPFDGNEYTRLGQLVHAMLEGFYTTEYLDVEVVSAGSEHADMLAEAYRLYEAYVEYYPRKDELGKVVATELFVEAKDEGVCGIVPYTGRIDMVVDVDERCIGRLLSERSFFLPDGAGRYIVDHKTTSRRPADDNPLRMWSKYQLWGYLRLYNAHSDIPAKGMIINTLIKHKDLIKNTSFPLYYVSYPEEEELGSFFKAMQAAKDSLNDSFWEVFQQ